MHSSTICTNGFLTGVDGLERRIISPVTPSGLCVRLLKYKAQTRTTRGGWSTNNFHKMRSLPWTGLGMWLCAWLSERKPGSSTRGCICLFRLSPLHSLSPSRARHGVQVTDWDPGESLQNYPSSGTHQFAPGRLSLPRCPLRIYPSRHWQL